MKTITRRTTLAAGAGIAGAARRRAAGIRAGNHPPRAFQTNIWGMPTYYLLKSGLLEKRGIQVRGVRRAVGNLTMQQDGGAASGLGQPMPGVLHHRPRQGGLVAVATDRIVARPRKIVTRKDLNLTKVEQLKGSRSPTRPAPPSAIFSSISSRQRPASRRRLPGGADWTSTTWSPPWPPRPVDAMVNVEPYNEIAVAEASALDMDYSSVDRMPVFMGRHARFRRQEPGHRDRLSQAWQDVARDFKESPGKVADVIYAFFTPRLQHVEGHIARRSRASRSARGFPSDAATGLQRTPRCCCARRRSPPSRTGRRRCGPSSGRRPARRRITLA